MDETNRSEAETAAGTGRVDELRQRLRALGYLDTGVDRFVLAPARRSRRPATIALLASLRIGVLGGALLGPAAAIGLVTRVPGLVTGPRDAIVAAVYLGIFFAILIAATSFSVAIATSWSAMRGSSPGFSRRATTLSIAAGIIVSAALLAYLTLWWRTASAGIAWASPGWTIFALVVAGAISLVLGHAVTVTSLAVAVARPGGDSVTAHEPGRSWKTSFAGGAVAFMGAAVLLFATAGQPPRQPATPPLTVRSSGNPVIVIAIDGFDAQLHERLRIASDAVRPAGSSTGSNGFLLSAARDLFIVLGAARADLAPSESTDPARLWTTIATGVGPEAHGITSLETRGIAGLRGRLGGGSTAEVIGAATDVLRLTRPAIASNFDRRRKTFWEVAEQAGLRTAVVNWWATWPAVASAGMIVSERAVLRLERGGPLDAELSPPELYERLKARWPQIQRDAQNGARSRLARDERFGFRSLMAYPTHLRAALLRSAELDATVMEIAEAISSEANLDLLVVYLPGLDIAQHTLLGGESGAPPSELELRIAALERYYVFLSQLTGAIIRGPDARRVFVITQGGRLHDGDGILAARGPGLQSEARISGTVLNVAPTILHALGIPTARELEGDVLRDLFTADSLTEFPIRYVDSYGLRGAVSAVRGDAPLDREAIDRLRSLGYIR